MSALTRPADPAAVGRARAALRPRRLVPGVGGVAWLVAALLLPAGTSTAERFLLLAPLVIAPLLVPPIVGRGSRTSTVVLVAAVPLVAALAVPRGPASALGVVPWVVVAAAMAIAAAPPLLRPPTTRLHRRVVHLGRAAALGSSLVAALALLVDRLALATPFPPAIVTLTAVHFHVAGLGLLGVAALAADRSRAAASAVVGLVAGLPLTALGFVVDVPLVNVLGSAVVGGSGIVLASVLVRGSGLERLAGLALAVGMPLGIAWSIAVWLELPFIGLETMVRTHGLANLAAVTLAALAASAPGRTSA